MIYKSPLDARFEILFDSIYYFNLKLATVTTQLNKIVNSTQLKKLLLKF